MYNPDSAIVLSLTQRLCSIFYYYCCLPNTECCLIALCSMPAATECESLGDELINDRIAYNSRRAIPRCTEKELNGRLQPQPLYTARTGDTDDICAGHSCLRRQDGWRAPAAAACRLPHRVQPDPFQPSHRNVQVSCYEFLIWDLLVSLRT